MKRDGWTRSPVCSQGERKLEVVQTREQLLATEVDITACYRLLLGREPDPAGFEHFKGRLHDMTVTELASEFMATAEFRRLRDTFDTIEQYGCKFLVPSGDPMYPRNDQYEPYVVKPLLEAIGSAATFLDVGANIGLFSVLAAKRGVSHVIAIEPSPMNTALILHNASLNGVQVDLHPVGAGERRGYAAMNAGKSNATITPNGRTVIPIAAIDELVEDAIVDVVKIDVEGYDYRAMRGALGLLSRCRPLIFAEYSPEFQQNVSGVDGRAYLDLYRRYGYRITVLHRDREPERVDAQEDIDEYWRLSKERYVTHLDLMLTPE